MAIKRDDVFTELRPYADMAVVPGVTVGDLAYTSAQTFHSEAIITSVGNVVNTNSSANLFYGAEGDTGQQGWTGQMTRTQTNWPYTRGTCSANNVFLGLWMGFDVSLVSSSDTSTILEYKQLNDATCTFGAGGGGALSAVGAICRNFSWDLTQGRGITRVLGQLDEYPAAEGAYTVASASGNTAVAAGALQWSAQNGMPGGFKQKLKIPLVFAPMIPTQVNVACGSGFTIAGLGASYIVIRASMTGYNMTVPA
jgi:hypothetical protein